MEKGTLIKCVPVEMVERLKKLSAKLWEDKNPAGVHLGAILDEFESDIKALSGVIQEYEEDCAARLKFAEEGHKEKIQALERDLAACKARLSVQEATRDESSALAAELGEALKRKEAELNGLGARFAEKEAQLDSRYAAKTQALEKDLAECRSRLSVLDGTRDESSALAAELNEALKRKEAELNAFSAQFAEKEAQLNTKYVAKMRELYDKVSCKELEIFSQWEEKNKALELSRSAAENEYAVKLRQIKLREQALEDEFNSRKEELVKVFDRMRLELDARERALTAREEKFSALEKKRPTVTEDL